MGSETFDGYGLPYGTVADQSPAGGRLAAPGSGVDLYIANGQN